MFSSMSLARQRLLLGITAVGATVLLAALALYLELPSRFLSRDASAPLSRAVGDALWWPVLFTLLLFPLDILGGVFAVRDRPAIGQWLRAWSRGVAVQLLLFTGCGALLIWSARQYGVAGAVLSTVVSSVAMLAWIDRLARAGAAMRTDPRRPTVVDAPDEAFVGGFAGLSRPRLTIPASWYTLADDVRDALIARRELAVAAHRLRGTLAAVAWTGAGSLLVSLLLGAPVSSASLVQFSLGCTVWSFLGVLVLPTPSRRAVLALDRASAAEHGSEVVARGIAALDRWGDDEPRRARWVEMIFHPVPSRDARIAALAMPRQRAQGAWRAARLALPSGIASWSVLGRAVHCNIGRPALWWMLPGD